MMKTVKLQTHSEDRPCLHVLFHINDHVSHNTDHAYRSCLLLPCVSAAAADGWMHGTWLLCLHSQQPCTYTKGALVVQKYLKVLRIWQLA